jgi:hypothetical protein
MLVFAALFVGYSSEWSSENNHRPWALDDFPCCSLQARPLISSIFHITCYSFFQDPTKSMLFHLHFLLLFRERHFFFLPKWQNNWEISILGERHYETIQGIQSFQFNLVHMYWQKIKELHIIKENKCNSKNSVHFPPRQFICYS